jgi:hypothetical protein
MSAEYTQPADLDGCPKGKVLDKDDDEEDGSTDGLEEEYCDLDEEDEGEK